MRNIILLCLSSRERKNRQTLHKHQRKKSEKSNVEERRDEHSHRSKTCGNDFYSDRV